MIAANADLSRSSWDRLALLLPAYSPTPSLAWKIVPEEQEAVGKFLCFPHEKSFLRTCQDLSLLSFCHSHAAPVAKLYFWNEGLREDKLNKRMKRLAISSLRCSLDLLQTTEQSVTLAASASTLRDTATSALGHVEAVPETHA